MDQKTISCTGSFMPKSQDQKNKRNFIALKNHRRSGKPRSSDEDVKCILAGQGTARFYIAAAIIGTETLKSVSVGFSYQLQVGVTCFRKLQAVYRRRKRNCCSCSTEDEHTGHSYSYKGVLMALQVQRHVSFIQKQLSLQPQKDKYLQCIHCDLEDSTDTSVYNCSLRWFRELQSLGQGYAAALPGCLSPVLHTFTFSFPALLNVQDVCISTFTPTGKVLLFVRFLITGPP